jgi:hypothetical protein
VPAGAFTAPTQLAADNLAQQAVNNLKICVPNTGDLGSALPSGQSGPRGATGNCNQGCSAHYA